LSAADRQTRRGQTQGQSWRPGKGKKSLRQSETETEIEKGDWRKGGRE